MLDPDPKILGERKFFFLGQVNSEYSTNCRFLLTSEWHSTEKKISCGNWILDEM
jgi:hypothetical protein